MVHESTYCEENIRNIHTDKYRIANGSKVDKIAPPAESRDSIVRITHDSQKTGIPY